MTAPDTRDQAVRGFRYVFASQILILILGLIKAFYIPGWLNVLEYGYWQIYVFYTTYVGIFTLGFNDGLYLRYGKHEFETLPFLAIRSSMVLYGLLLLIGCVTCFFAMMYDTDVERRAVLYLVSANILVMGLLAVFYQILQATNRLRDFSLFNSIDKFLILILMIPFFFVGTGSYFYLIYSDLASKVVVLIAVMVRYRELVVGSLSGFSEGLKEAVENILSGSKLMIANITGMLTLGVGRLFVEQFEALEDYAFYSFGVSITNLVLVVITAMSITMYPALKRTSLDSYLLYYNIINRNLFLFNVLMLLAYFPAVYIVQHYLPKYLPVLDYLNILFVISTLQAKMQLLNNTYYKSLRYEGRMLLANLSSVITGIGLTAAAHIYIGSIASIAWATFLTMLLRTYMSEYFLRQKMKDADNRFLRGDMPVPFIFIAMTSILPFPAAAGIAALLVTALLFVMRAEILRLLRVLLRFKG